MGLVLKIDFKQHNDKIITYHFYFKIFIVNSSFLIQGGLKNTHHFYFKKSNKALNKNFKRERDKKLNGSSTHNFGPLCIKFLVFLSQKYLYLFQNIKNSIFIKTFAYLKTFNYSNF